MPIVANTPFTLPPAGWNLSSASYDSVSLFVFAQDSAAQDVAFSSDGTKMYVVCSSTETIYQYSL